MIAAAKVDLLEWLVATAGCAAAAPRPAAIVRSALQAGLEAAFQGRLLPLAPLLDMESSVAERALPSQIVNRPVPQQAARRYDDFLVGLCERAYRPLFVRRLGDRDEQEEGARAIRPDYLPMLLIAWPAAAAEPDHGGPADWAAAYRRLLEDPQRLDRIADRWRQPRSTDIALWRAVWPEADQFRDSPAADMWAAFAAQTGRRDVHERYDHHANQLYFHACDPLVLPDQDCRIRLLRTRQQAIYDMMKRTPEDQDPYIGQIPLAAMVREIDELQSAVVNHELARLNRQPVHRPIRVHVHLCWWVGLAALEAEHSVIKISSNKERSLHGQQKPPPRSVRATYASTVKGLAALLLDDWRNALRGLPVWIHLHRGRKPEFHARVGRPGPRWKTSAIEHGPLPPLKAIEALFRRETYVGAALAPSGWHLDDRSDRGDGHWYCGVAARHDLPEMGFCRRGDVWVARQPLPACLKHLIVVDDAKGMGTIYAVKPPLAGREAELRTLDGRRIDWGECDASFEALRTRALDVVLAQLQAIAR